MKDPAELEALAVSLAGALDLPLPEEFRAGVVQNLAVAFRLAPLFLDFPLPDEAEPLPVYLPLEGQ